MAPPRSAFSTWNPVALLRARVNQWFINRITPRDTVTLTQRNVYILPTSPGFMLGATLLVLLVASINYQLNLGYVLTFLLTGSAVVGMQVCHGTLRGITMHLIAPEAHFAGANVTIGVNLLSDRRSVRYGIGLAVLGTQHWSWTDVPAQGSANPWRYGCHQCFPVHQLSSDPYRKFCAIRRDQPRDASGQFFRRVIKSNRSALKRMIWSDSLIVAAAAADIGPQCPSSATLIARCR